MKNEGMMLLAEENVMVAITKNATLSLNGSSRFTIESQSTSWTNRWIGALSLDGTSTTTGTMALSGSDWSIGSLTFGTLALATLKDSDSASGRTISSVTIQSAASIKLLSTVIGTLTTSDFNDTVTTGSGYIRSIDLAGGTNRLTLGSGGAGDILTGSGNDTITIGSGAVQHLSAGDGTNKIVSGSGWIGTITTGSGSDTISLGSGGAEAVSAGSGNNVISTSTGYVRNITTLGGNDRITIGAAGAQDIAAGDGTNVVTTTTGWVGTITTGSGSDTIAIGSGGANDIWAGNGSNVISTGSAWVNSISTGSGADRITTGSGGVGLVSGGAGSDTFNVGVLQADKSVRLDGGTGTDTADFSAYGSGVTLSLNGITGWQNLPSGYVILTGIEKLVGTASNDVLTGSSDASNRNNILVGGGGADILTGLSGADVFQFNAVSDSVVGTGHDTITDFHHLEGDRLDLSRMDANVATTGDQAFSWFDDGQYHANGLWLSGGVLHGDVDGIAGADFEIALTGVTSLSSSDFLL
jgi:Ca2+-binding RTX toxin-like protein